MKYILKKVSNANKIVKYLFACVCVIALMTNSEIMINYFDIEKQLPTQIDKLFIIIAAIIFFVCSILCLFKEKISLAKNQVKWLFKANNFCLEKVKNIVVFLTFICISCSIVTVFYKDFFLTAEFCFMSLMFFYFTYVLIQAQKISLQIYKKTVQ